jgi:ABC-type branched-subunit amino acid transport system substrate-binding protein
MLDSVLTLTTPIVYPGGFTSPPNQYRLGFLLTDSVAAAAAAPSNLANLTATIGASAMINSGYRVSFASIPSQLALYGARLAAAAISGCGISALKLQLQSLNPNIFFSTDNALLGGRDSILIPSSQTQYDDCGVNPSVAFQAVKNMLINRGVVAIIGSSCGVVVNNLLTGSDPADVTSKVFPLSIPMISYNAFETQLSSNSAYSYFLRTNLPQRNETSILLSVLNEFGWSRVCIVTTDSQMGANAVADIAALLALYGARAEQYLNLNSTILAGGVSSIISNIITPLKANNARVIVLLLDSVALLTGFLQAAQQSQFYGPNIQFVAYRYFDLNFLAASFVPPISSVVSQGLLYTSTTIDTSQAQYTAMMNSWSVSPVTAAYASLTSLPTEVAYAWDAVTLIGTTLAGTFNGLPMSTLAYTPATFMSALRSTSITGATGPISFASAF